jgi:hypothetical protein
MYTFEQEHLGAIAEVTELISVSKEEVNNG